jgi:hypothetical protein
MRQNFHLRAAVAVVTLAGLPALADVTLRYKSEIKMNPTVPAAMAQQAAAGIASLPKDTTLQWKGGKGFSSVNGMTSIYDFAKKEITLIDTEGKRYATLAAADFADHMTAAMPAMPQQAKAILATMKSHFDSKATGNTARIQGIEGEERQMEITVDAPAMPNVPAGPMMRTVMHFWTAKSSETMRVPAVREVMEYNLYAAATMNPIEMMAKMMQQMPGFADGFASMMKEFHTGGTPVVLRSSFEMYMPMLGAMMKANPGASPFGAGFDADAPLMTMNQELAEVSTAAVPDSVFQIPEGYKAAPATDILKDMMAKMAKVGAKQ